MQIIKHSEMPPKRSVATSGITTSKTGDRVVAASVRADGSIRPERKVRQGFTPAEDVTTYKNERAETFRSHQYGHKDYVPPGLVADAKGRRSKKPGQADGGEQQVQGIGQEDPEKKARALQKKIKAARDLKERQAKGDKLEDSQIAKIGMLETFEKELAALNLGESNE